MTHPENEPILDYGPGSPEREALKKELARHNKASIEALRNDPKTVERFAREKLGLAKIDETVFRFEEPDPERQ